MDQIVELELSVNELNILLAGLAELPLKYSGGLSAKLQKTATDQLGSTTQQPSDSLGAQ